MSFLKRTPNPTTPFTLGLLLRLFDVLVLVHDLDN